MSCCAGNKCGISGVGGRDDAPLLESRYPKTDGRNGFIVDEWKAPEPPAVRQPFRPTSVHSKETHSSSLPPFTYAGQNLAACDFPLGGFGGGNVILHGDGTLQGFTCVNQVRDETLPMHDVPACFFGISAGPVGENKQSFALASPETYTERNCGLPRGSPARVSPASVRRLRDTLPGVQSLQITGRYPIADVAYTIAGFPLSVSLEAMTPVIPGDTKSSSLPTAIFTFSVFNPSKDESVDVRIMQAQQNFVGWDGHIDATAAPPIAGWGGNVNTAFSGNGSYGGGLTFSNPSLAKDDYRNGTVCVAAHGTGCKVSTIVASTSESTLWQAFVGGKDQPVPTQGQPPVSSTPSKTGTAPCGAVIQETTIAPGQTAKITFCLAWHFPNRERDRSCGTNYKAILPAVLGNYYSATFADANAVSAYVAANSAYLLGTTRLYRDTIFSSTIPANLLDSAAGRVAVMNSGTMWRCLDGTVMGTEGNGCCPLNCTHVYGYTTLIERLFPDLAKDMRHSDFVKNYAKGTDAGGCTMRFGTGGWAIDGALACIIKVYLVVRQSDSTLKWLPTVWPNVKDQLARIRANFDTYQDGAIRTAQQNTYDTAMNGANTFIGSYYVTALRAVSEMATLMGEPDLAKDCSARATLSAASYEKICWVEKYSYYIADVDSSDCQNSYSVGCFVDQLCGTGLASACGFGHVFNAAHEARARQSVLTHNAVTKPPWNDLQMHLFDGDTGITVCTYPHGKIGKGMMYDTLVSTGFTSPNIAGMLLDRNTEGAELFCEYIRNRQDGRNRSPWNEPECNVLYSRAMAHWNIFDQACGHTYDSTSASLGFDPRYSPTNFKCFCSLEGGWGSFAQTGSDARLSSGTVTLTCLWGSFQLKQLRLCTTAKQVSASVAGAVVAGVTIANGVITLSSGNPIAVKAGEALNIKLSGGAVTLDVGGLHRRRQCCSRGGCCDPDKSRAVASKADNINRDMATAGAVTSSQIFSKLLRDFILFALVFCAGALSVWVALLHREEEEV